VSENLLRALAQLRGRLLDPETLVRAVASGRQKGAQPRWRRVELRYVDLKAGRHLQLTAYDETQAHTSNHLVAPGNQQSAARDAVDDLLDEPFGNWHVEALVPDGGAETVQLRVTRKGEALVHTSERREPAEVDRGHDRDKDRLLPEDDPLFRALGLADAEGRLKPSRRDKYRQVEEFLRLLDTAVTEAIAKGQLRTPTPDAPLRVADLGCGNAYLTFAAERYLVGVRGLPVHLVGVDVKEQSREHNEKVAGELGLDAEFVVGTIGGAVLASLVLAAPCCHHDVAAQLRRAPTPAPYAMLTRHGILRERLADTLTDALRATLMRLQGYRVDVVQFVESKHTPRNTLLRATRTGAPVKGGSLKREYDDLVTAWGIHPKLAELLEGPRA
jgi:SAM-dependent methyltransferase